MNPKFKESLTAYKTDSNPVEPMSGSLLSFQSELGATLEPYVEDLSGNTYNTYYNTYRLDDRRDPRPKYAPLKDEKKEKNEEPIDNSLLFMGLGVAGLGAAVILVMALRK